VRRDGKRAAPARRNALQRDGRGQIDSGIIDALFERDGAWTIVEFKTDEVRKAGDLADLLAREDYLPQVRRYAHAVRLLLGVEPRCMLCFLDVAGAVHLHEVDPGGAQP
jgi:ATP-dependent exoDNAse (exonuclease V) beta subunit